MTNKRFLFKMLNLSIFNIYNVEKTLAKVKLITNYAFLSDHSDNKKNFDKNQTDDVERSSPRLNHLRHACFWQSERTFMYILRAAGQEKNCLYKSVRIRPRFFGHSSLLWWSKLPHKISARSVDDTSRPQYKQ